MYRKCESHRMCATCTCNVRHMYMQCMSHVHTVCVTCTYMYNVCHMFIQCVSHVRHMHMQCMSHVHQNVTCTCNVCHMCIQCMTHTHTCTMHVTCSSKCMSHMYTKCVTWTFIHVCHMSMYNQPMIHVHHKSHSFQMIVVNMVEIQKIETNWFEKQDKINGTTIYVDWMTTMILPCI